MPPPSWPGLWAPSHARPREGLRDGRRGALRWPGGVSLQAGQEAPPTAIYFNPGRSRPRPFDRPPHASPAPAAMTSFRTPSWLRTWPLLAIAAAIALKLLPHLRIATMRADRLPLGLVDHELGGPGPPLRRKVKNSAIVGRPLHARGAINLMPASVVRLARSVDFGRVVGRLRAARGRPAALAGFPLPHSPAARASTFETPPCEETLCLCDDRAV